MIDISTIIFGDDKEFAVLSQLRYFDFGFFEAAWLDFQAARLISIDGSETELPFFADIFCKRLFGGNRNAKISPAFEQASDIGWVFIKELLYLSRAKRQARKRPALLVGDTADKEDFFAGEKLCGYFICPEIFELLLDGREKRLGRGA